MKYLESYNVAGISYGIEESRLKHIKNPRFRVWKNGGSIGSAESIDKARYIIHLSAKQSLERKLVDLEQEIIEGRAAVDKLGNDVFNLGRFLV